MTYLFEDFELDTANFELRKGGERVAVEPQVFDVLAYLVRHSDRIVSRDELLDNVWNDRYVSDSALSSRVMSARKAVGDGGKEQRLIKTVHGRGFKFLGRMSGPAAVQSEPERKDLTAAKTMLAVGRQEELEQLVRSFEDATAGKRSGTFLLGPAGMGKTTLLRDFLVSASSEAAVVFGQCVATSGPGEPYRPLIQALSDFATQHPEIPVAKTLLQRAPTWFSQIPWIGTEEQAMDARARALGATQERMLREFIDCIEGLSHDRPIVLAIDDLHWSDLHTIEVLAAAVRRFAPARILVIASVRSDENVETSVEVQKTIRELTVKGEARTIELAPLDRTAVRDMAVRVIGDDEIDEDLVGSLHRRTEGHPLFLSTVLEEVSRHGRDALQTVPATVRNFVEMHFQELSPEDQEIVGAASLISRKFCAEAVAAMLDKEPDSFEDEVIRVARSGRFFVRCDAERLNGGKLSAAFKFNHDLVMETCAEFVSHAKTKLWYRRFAYWAETAFEWELDRRAPGLAEQFFIAEEWGKSIEYLLRSSRVAFGRAAAREALASARLGLDRLVLVKETESRKRLELQLLSIYAPARIAIEGWSADFESIYLRALELADECGGPQERFVLIHGLATFYEMRGEYTQSERLLRDLAAAEARELLACSNFHQGKFEEALAHAEEALKASSPDGHSELMAYHGENPSVSSEQWAGLSLWFLGRPQEAVERATHALEVAESPGLKYSLASARGQLAFLHQIRRDPEETKKWALATIEIGESNGLTYRAAYGRILLGWSQALLGDSDEGIANMREGLDVVRSIGAVIEEPYLLGIVGDGLAHVGETGQALKFVDEALEQATIKRGFFFESELLRLRGTLEDDPKEAKKWFGKAVKAAEDQGNVSILLRSLTTLAEKGDKPALKRLQALIAPLPEDFECPDVERAKSVIAACGS